MCTELDPYWAKGWYRRGLAQVGLERYRDAEESYRRGVGIVPPKLMSMPIILARLSPLRMSSRALAADYAPRDDDLQRALQEVKMML